ncbi:uncharacterized protein B0P05DRAFT_545822 [Gilbertella persicaria]|uniref:Uncharacterized protein n=1 Tax=Rhizopus stolonifer TaxID=4846 RepID=A0A367KQ24_RHIST|nr:uncharacterized protein B0P05DRAFT_545822 [Gilbertella persicaria]KAI8076422.1 hypothetical protein B0P05DRAFT_545822 [Gilbertella persicaria]RCI04271.1 hypothetical protein CU098_011071 [Rhizopus stolonifer]
MTVSLFNALPSIQRNKKTIENKPQFKRQPLQFKLSRNHGRTTSVPAVLPSHRNMNVLLDAIDLDQQMRQFFKAQVMKSKACTATFMPTATPPSIMMARRRSKSAPGAPPSYHQQRAFNARWTAPHCNTTVTSASEAEKVAQFIVQQHFESVKKR